MITHREGGRGKPRDSIGMHIRVRKNCLGWAQVIFKGEGGRGTAQKNTTSPASTETTGVSSSACGAMGPIAGKWIGGNIIRV